MSKRSKTKRIVTSILVSVLMMFQCFTVYGAELTEATETTKVASSSTNFVPDEVKNAEKYKEIPVYFEGEKVTVFEKYLRKYNDTAQNANERFDISGTATFRVKAYAYKTGSEIKLGTYIECLGEDGKWFRMNWRDKEDQVSSSDLEKFMNEGKELSVTVDDIRFTLPDTNKDELRVIFDMSASTGGTFSRDTEKNVQFYKNDDVIVDRTVTEVVGEKNVWEVELKVQATQKVESLPTDVVFVLDRSGSMSAERRNLVIDATKDLADSLLELDNINVGLVTFGQYAGSIPAEGAAYYDKDWNTVRLTKQQREDKYDDEDDRKKWAGATVDEDFTDDEDDIKDSIEERLKSVSGGTPISLALIEATKMFMDEDYMEDTNDGKNTNKVIILVSDGAPSFARDGSGTGNINENSDDSWAENQYIVDDTIAVSKEALTKVDNLTIFTLAAGNAITEKGKDVLKKCASNENYAYTAKDSEEELEKVMKEISEVIKTDIATGVVLDETLTHNISLDCPEGNIKDKVTEVKLTNAETGKTEAIDWEKTAIAITQGEIKEAENHKLNWNIGELKDEAPAIIKYRITLDSGKLGQKYKVSEQCELNYTDSNGNPVSKPVPNHEIDLSWAKINMTTVDQKVSTVVSDSELSLWYKVPETFTADSMKFNYDLQYNSTSKEVTAAGDKVVKDSIKLQQSEGGEAPVKVGAVVDNQAYSVSEMETAGVSLTQSPTTVTNLINTPHLESVSTDKANFIQPEGVSNISTDITFTNKSKNASYTVDTSNMVTATLDGKTLMNYDFTKLSVQVKKLGTVPTGDTPLAEGTDYTVVRSGNNITVALQGVLDAGDKFRVDVYIPTSIGNEITYGGSGITYLTDVKGNKIDVDNIMKSTPKVSDFTLEDGTIEEVYGVEAVVDSKIVTGNKVTLTYMAISQIN